MDFAESNRVRMYGDFNDESLSAAQESSFAIRNTGIPSLIFDSYNYIHLPADPDNGVNGGTQGVGLSSDFEFSILHVSQDTLILKGNLRSNDLKLVQISSGDRTAVEGQGFLTTVNNVKNYFAAKLNNYILVNVNGQERKVGISYGHSTRQLAYSYFDESSGDVSSSTATFNYSVNGLEVLSDDLKFGDVVFSGARFKADGTMYLVDAAGKEYTLQQNAVPLIPFHIMFGFGKTYPVLRIPGEVLPANVTSDWSSVYMDMVDRFNGTGRTIAFTEVILASPTTGFVVIRYAAASAFTAVAKFTYAVDDQQVMTISSWDSSAGVANSNWTSRNTQVGAFATWFQNHGPFKLDWVSGSDALLGGLYSTQNPTNFLYGILRETPEIAVQQYL